MRDTIELNVAGQTVKIVAYPSRADAISIALNTASGCVWRGLVGIDGTLHGHDAANSRAILAAALKTELAQMRVAYAGGGIVLGVLIAIVARGLLA